MKNCRAAFIKQDAKDFQDGEIFVVHAEAPASAFLITEKKPDFWAFAFKHKGKFTLSTWKPDNVGMDEVMKSKNQILYCKKNGWSNSGELRMDSVGERQKLYSCIYCGNESCEPDEVHKPCKCRGIISTEQKSKLDLWLG